jgi:hypothetical protein
MIERESDEYTLILIDAYLSKEGNEWWEKGRDRWAPFHTLIVPARTTSMDDNLPSAPYSRESFSFVLIVPIYNKVVKFGGSDSLIRDRR